MIYNSKSKKNVVGELSQKMLLNCSKIYAGELFSLSISIPPPPPPPRSILTWVVSARTGPFSFQPDFFTKLNTCPSVYPYTYNNAYIITFRLWPKRPKPEMTHSENWQKWPTYQGRNDSPS